MKEYKPKFEPVKPIASSHIGKAWMGTLGVLGAGQVAGLGLMATVRGGSAKEHRHLMHLKNELEKNKGLKVNYEHSEMPISSHFNPKTNTVHSSGDLAIGAHEFGHAQNYRAYQKAFGEKGGKLFGAAMYGTLENIPVVGRTLAGSPLSQVPISGALALPFLSKKVTNAIKGKNTESKRYSIGDKIEKHPGSIMAAAVSPKLVEEASASVRAVHDIARYMPKGQKLKEVGKAFAKLTPAFGTYAAMASVPVIGAWAFGKTRENNMTKKAQQLLNKIAAFTQHGKMMQEGRAKSQYLYSQEARKANEKYPGMAFAKGTQVAPILSELSARRNAYVSQGPGKQIKAMIPGVGMGKKGKEALEKLID